MKVSFVICGARLRGVTDCSLIDWLRCGGVVSPRCEQAVTFALARRVKKLTVRPFPRQGTVSTVPPPAPTQTCHPEAERSKIPAPSEGICFCLFPSFM